MVCGSGASTSFLFRKCEQAFELSDASAERSAAGCTIKLNKELQSRGRSGVLDSCSPRTSTGELLAKAYSSKMFQESFFGHERLGACSEKADEGS